VQADNPALKIIRPALGETWQLAAGRPARRLSTGRTDIQQAMGHDWQNDYADFATSLKEELAHIKGDAARRHAIAEMKRVLGAAQAG
jgi:metallo-beta-lactamase family protein